MSLDITPDQRPHAPTRFREGVYREYRVLLILSSLLIGAFIVPLSRLVRYIIEPGSLYSYIVLIPFVSAYLIWIQRKSLGKPERGSFPVALAPSAVGISLLSLYFFLSRKGMSFSNNDFLFIHIAAFYCFLLAIAVGTIGTRVCRQIIFPLGFLVFIIPFPDAMTTSLENASKYASAEMYAQLMNLFGATYYRQGFYFALPNLNIEVAQECSGIRSSLVLFITSLIAGYMFLSKSRNRILLALLVLPLGVIRNAFRILVLSLLTIHWDPHVIDSPLHHKGGPLFFALSLVPFFFVLFMLSKSEKASRRAPTTPAYA